MKTYRKANGQYTTEPKVNWKKATVLGIIAFVIVLFFVQSTSSVTIENTPTQATSTPEIAEEVLTPEIMIERATAHYNEKMQKHYEASQYYKEWVDHMQVEITKMQEEADRRFELASTTDTELNTATKALNDLRDLLDF